MKILHAYCLNHNIGDYYLGIGLKNLLRHYLRVDLIAETNLQGTVFNEYYIENVVNKKYDLLVVGGGGIIHGSHWPNGWFWLIRQELIRKINIPFIIYGAGYNYFNDEGGIPSIGRSHLRETIRRCMYFSVRNDGSAERLFEQLRISVPEIPDPGFHINLNRTYECIETDPFVIIQPANDKPEHRFANLGGREHFIAETRKAVAYLSKKYRVIMAPHVYEDVILSQRIIEGIPNAKSWDFSKYAFDRATESIGYYQRARFVLAMRGHGQIVPIAFNTPVIAIENHPKHVGLMKKLGLDEYNISITSEDLSSNLISKILYLEENIRAYRDKLSKINKDLWSLTESGFSEIISRLSKTGLTR